MNIYKKPIEIYADNSNQMNIDCKRIIHTHNEVILYTLKKFPLFILNKLPSASMHMVCLNITNLLIVSKQQTLYYHESL